MLISYSYRSGFHVQPDGLVTLVESTGCAARAGIKRGARLLEVCRAAVVALHHEQLVDLLKTSDPVTVQYLSIIIIMISAYSCPLPDKGPSVRSPARPGHCLCL